MANLKDKLSQKVEMIHPNDISEVNFSESDSQIYTKASNENLIILKTPEDLNSVSVTPDFAISIKEAKDRISMLQNFIKEMMVPNVDYGIIPKCDKPSLFKSGAEKLCDIFGFSKQIQILNRIEDWDKGLFHYEIKVILTNKRTGIIESEGIGSCNSREKKYKFQDSYSIINTLLKMSKKRALIDAVLSATRSSGIFTQDMEDFQDDPIINQDNSSKEQKNPISKGNGGAPLPTNEKSSPINKKQQSELFSIVAKKDLSTDEIKRLMHERYKVVESRSLSKSQADNFIQFLNRYGEI